MCPYRGLAAYGTDDAGWFFGRERATAALVQVVTARLGAGPADGSPVAAFDDRGTSAYGGPAPGPSPSGPRTRARCSRRRSAPANAAFWSPGPTTARPGCGGCRSTAPATGPYRSVSSPVTSTACTPSPSSTGTPWSPGASGRYSHYNGYKVDIALRSCVNEYIADRFRYLGRRSDGARRYRFPGGNPYAREGDHWDITYYHASEAGRERAPPWSPRGRPCAGGRRVRPAPESPCRRPAAAGRPPPASPRASGRGAPCGVPEGRRASGPGAG